MKSAVSLALSMCLVSPAFQAAAQDRIELTPGPIARAITREAVRLGTDPQVGKPTDLDWARVRRLAPGTEITVTVRPSQAGKRIVLLADESNLTVLNLTDLRVSVAETRTLLDMALHHPDYFATAPKGGQFVDTHVRLGPDGVFVADRKIADLDQIVETIRATKVVEVKAQRRKGSALGAVGGAAGGFLLGLLGAAYIANCEYHCSGQLPLFVTSLVATPVVGGVVGYYAFGRTTEQVIYRAP